MSDIVERLKTVATRLRAWNSWELSEPVPPRIDYGEAARLIDEGAAEIATLRSQVARATEPTDEMLIAMQKVIGQWVDPSPPEREQSVIVDPGLSEEDADRINAELRDNVRDGWKAALAAISSKK